MISLKKFNLIIISIAIVIVSIISISKIKNHSYMTSYIDKYYINKQSIDEELKEKIYSSINNNKLNDDEKYLSLGYLEKNENIDLAKKYFTLGIENINENTCYLTKAYLYKFLSDISIQENDINKAIKYTELSINSIDSKHYRNNSKLILNIIKSISSLEEGRDIAITYLNDILKHENLDIDSRISFMRLLSTIYILNFDYANAISLNLDIINLNDSTNLKYTYSLNKSMVDMSVIARELGGYKSSIKILNGINSEKIDDELLKADLEIYKNINLAQIQNIIGMNEDALNSVSEITKYEKYIPNPKKNAIECLKNIIIAQSYANSDIELAKKHLSNSTYSLKTSKKIYPDIDIYYSIVLGEIYLNQKNYKESIKQFEQCLEMSDKVSSEEYKKLSYIYLINIYTKLNDHENTNKYVDKLETTQKTKNELIVSTLYKYIEYKDNYEILQKKKTNTKYALIVLFIIITVLVSILLKTIIYPYFKKEHEKKKVLSYIKNNNYMLNYQPIINPKTDKIIAFESLLRLKINEKIVYPDVIIKQIERCNMISEVSIWILEKITNDYDKINKIKNLNNNFYLSMNVSLKEIEDEIVCNRFVQIFKNSNLSKKSICLEITENVSGKDYIQIRKNVKILMDSGFLIAIDDFGVDYSNLSFLEELDFNIIKLDKYFIDHFYNSIVVQSLIDAIHYISIKKDVSIVIEGVEEKEQVESIKNFKSDKFYIQGYYYSKPVGINDLSKIKIDD